MNRQRGFFSVTTAEWYTFLAVVAVVGYLIIRGAEWGVHHIHGNPVFSMMPRDSSHDFTLVAASKTTIYLEYKGDGTVWALWPDGRFIQVVPAK